MYQYYINSLIYNYCLSYTYHHYRIRTGDHQSSTSIILRYGIPAREAAALLTAFMDDEHMLTKDNRPRIIDRNVIRKWKRMVFANQICHQINGLYFDGKIDKTRQADGTFKNEDNLTIFQSQDLNLLLM